MDIPFLRVRFRLRTIFILLTLLCIAFGTVGVRAYRDYQAEQAVAAIRGAGGTALALKGGSIHRVHLQGKKFDDAKLGALVPHLLYLPELNELDLVECPVTDRGLKKLSALHRLRELYVFETQVTDEGTAALQRSLPQLVIKLEAPDPVATNKLGTHIYRHAISSLAMSNDGRQFVTGSGDGTLRWWSGATSEEKVAAHSDWIFAAAYSPDSTLLATGGGDRIIGLWDTKTRRRVGKMQTHRDDVHAIVFSPDGRWLFSTSDDRTVRRSDVSSYLDKDAASVRGKTLGEHEDTVPCIAIDPAGLIVASGSRDDTIGLWNAACGGKIRTLTGHTGDVMSLAFASDGKTLASGSYDGTLRLWNVGSGATVAEMTGHAGRVFSIAISYDDQLIASAGEDGLIVWDRTTLTPRFRLDQIKNASCVRFDPDDQELIVSDASGSVRFIEVSTGAISRRLDTSKARLAVR